MTTSRLDLYTDYLSVSFGAATATGLARMLDGDISHDAVTRFLSQSEFSSKDLWQQVKSTVREIESDDGVIIFDDTIQEKPYTDENDLICWHYDHCVGRNVKGINLLNCLYHANDVSLPVAFELIRKPLRYCEIKTKREKRKSGITKNQQLRDMVDNCVRNQLKFSWVLADIWFGSTENMIHIKQIRQKDFVMAMKSNRLVALNEADHQAKRYTRLDQLDWPEAGVVTGYLKGLPFPVRLARQRFTEDGYDIPFLTDGQALTIPVAVENTTATNANVVCWIDYNGDGVFATDGAESGAVAVAAGFTGSVDVIMPQVPATATNDTGGSSYARCRLSTDSALNASIPTGALVDGEVEDQNVSFTAAPVFDLALRKQLTDPAVTSFQVGDTVGFTIEIYNQGTVDATDIEIT